MYNCNICEYSTNDSGNFSKHKQTKKHLDNLNNKELIEKENQTLKEKLKEMETEYKHKIEIMEKEKEKLEAVIKVYEEKGAKTINNTQNNTINIGSINYVKEHFKEAPPLEKITNFIINGIDTNDSSQHDKFIEEVLYHNNNKILHEYLGDHIVSLYKKTDLSKQSFHTTDTSRLNYVIRIFENDTVDINSEEDDFDEFKDIDSEDDRYSHLNWDTMTDDQREYFKIKIEYDKQLDKMNKKKEEESQIIKFNNSTKKVWATDKNGYKICKLLIDPTIKQLVNILKKKIKVKVTKKINIDNLNNELKYHQSISDILENIDTKKLKNDVNKYIAPKFNLEKKK